MVRLALSRTAERATLCPISHPHGIDGCSRNGPTPHKLFDSNTLCSVKPNEVKEDAIDKMKHGVVLRSVKIDLAFCDRRVEQSGSLRRPLKVPAAAERLRALANQRSTLNFSVPPRSFALEGRPS